MAGASRPARVPWQQAQGDEAAEVPQSGTRAQHRREPDVIPEHAPGPKADQQRDALDGAQGSEHAPAVGVGRLRLHQRLSPRAGGHDREAGEE
ncbi:MAG: hypothetical protein QOF73_1867, partial [Thermomicrobiales bacterium]|nr:hypothetical protein [Thermomicrobiales bacterium]